MDDFIDFWMELITFVIGGLLILFLLITLFAGVIGLMVYVTKDTSPRGQWEEKLYNECRFLDGKPRFVKDTNTFECWYLNGPEPKKIKEEKWE